MYWFVTLITSIPKLHGWIIDRQATKHGKTMCYLLPSRFAETCYRFFIICFSTVIYLLSWWPYGDNKMHSNIRIGIFCCKFFGFHSDAYEVSACLGYNTVSMSDLCPKYLRQCSGLNEFGIPKKLLRLINMCLTEMYSKVWVGKNLSEMFPIRNGLKQGDALSPLISTLLWNMPLSGFRQTRMAWI
jgi:hypothetical protein